MAPDVPRDGVYRREFKKHCESDCQPLEKWLGGPLWRVQPGLGAVGRGPRGYLRVGIPCLLFHSGECGPGVYCWQLA